jgi:hypothetical protein
MIINLTQHTATPEQVAAGVQDLPQELRAQVIGLLTFDDIPDTDFDEPDNEVRQAAKAIAKIASDFLGGEEGAAMIGGAPFLLPILAEELRGVGIDPLLAFSRRETIEESQPDGGVRKVAVFRHVGFIRHP